MDNLDAKIAIAESRRAGCEDANGNYTSDYSEGMSDAYDQCLPIIRALVAERDELRKDAERYRWLVDEGRDLNIAVSECMTTDTLWMTGDQLSEIIDSAMSKEQKP